MSDCKIVYIGENENSFSHFKNICPTLARCESVQCFVDKVSTNTDKKDCVIVLFETSDRHTNSNVLSIKALRRSFRGVYIIIVTDGLRQTERKIYLQSGVNDTISPTVSAEKLINGIDFIKRYHSLLVDKKETTHSAQSFKLPIWKRSFDILASSAAIIVLSPLLIVTYVAVLFTSRANPVYKSQRVGSNYKVFDFYKFRSMYVDADRRLAEFKNSNQYSGQSFERSEERQGGTGAFVSDDIGEVVLVSDDTNISELEYIKQKRDETDNSFVKIVNDPRITPVGRFIRKYSIDELPQLFNILKGDMSVVGNRPLPLYEAEMITQDEYIERFMAPAGLTGLWQVEKRGGEGALSPEERKQLDIKYAREFSLLLDIKIILRTFGAFIQKSDV